MSNSPWAFAGFGLELAATVILGGLAGSWLDGRLGSAPWLVVLGASAGLVLGMGNLVRRLNLWKRENKPPGDENGVER